ncbi:hypothetical protein GTR02_19175 [Kineococcus sp. R8]|uniref:hypothetical protein n=1 Tax=Kineococcus siccus TaxID=2696567 RepID=UPI001412AD05|nr:hypothetical protein [Kineococcus siccus]NAZ83938.1 hypothetical protein [Kineococcus siccus]
MSSQTDAPAGESTAARAAAARAAAARANAEAAALADAAAMEAAAEAAALKQAATAAEVAAQTAAVEAATYKQKALDSSPDLGGDDAAHAGPAPDRGTRLLGAYLGRVGALLGVGLIAIGVAHFPPGPLRFGVLLGVGLLLVVASAYVTEVRLAPPALHRPSLLRVLGSALLLGVSVGMLTGGVAHYADHPTRCAFLVPLGLLGSFLAHTIRQRAVLDGAVSWVGGAVAVVTLASFLVLFGLALSSARAAEEAGTGASTGVAEHATDEHATDEHATDEHATDEHAPAAEPAPAAVPAAATVAPAAEEHATEEHATEEHAAEPAAH